MASNTANENPSRVGEQNASAAEPSQSTWRSIWQNNKGALLILSSVVCGASMDAIARFLQQGGGGFHTLQIITARMGITLILSTLYMWWTSVPYFPLGHPEIRGWLVLRALFGFMGLFTLYYSVHYLPLAEATVFRFLIPITTAWACYIVLGQPFTRKELIAGLVALVGVVLIAHPESIFGKVDDHIHAYAAPEDLDDVAPAQRMLAIVLAVLGVVGAAGAYTTIRIMGDRAHALISVNYFALVATVGSVVAMLATPGIEFIMPSSPREWALLVLLGFLGFVLQFLLTSGLQLDKSPKATSMLYTQVIFALMFDWAIWGVLPGGWSLVGGAIIIASTLWSALQKTPPPKKADTKKVADEETALLGPQTEGVEETARASSPERS
ncbi:hypothetical protein KVR01_006697 [Diaporthe batatas]|uniref:uncharacterized protein n=1 Tax=Diaporthe batatas TaxID=748121 RepID=UPI001D05511E|nr:uncharacterized protein KVR01_006697 [Diaporthe batatas]KAG8163400.1 hypothetical protein KVR01_006697 [Diaporthe batatas]